MNKNIIIVPVTLMMATFTACTSSSDSLVSEEAGTSLKFRVGIEATESRAGITATDFSDQQTAEMGLFAYTAADHSTLYGSTTGNNHYQRSSAGLWSSVSAAEDLTLTSTNATIWAYYPYVSGATDPTAIPVNVNADQGSGQSDGKLDSGTPDVMYASPMTVDNTLVGATFSLHHALAQVAVKFVRDESSWSGYYGQGNVTSLLLKDADSGALRVGEGTLNIFTGATIPGSGNSILVRPAKQPVLGATDAAEIPAVLVYPTMVVGNIFFNVELDGRTYTLTLPAPASGFQASHRYVFSIKVSRTYEPDDVTGAVLTLSSISVQDWNTHEMENIDIIVNSNN